ncbi:MAG TPA: carbonic anhydrase [Stenotrophobium sp.]|jgi:carbonic anhydrase|nr:carbonic anhydrase [Stenotrophobium sp.]
MISALEALARLREGNQRFASGAWRRDTFMSEARRNELVAGQEPIATILGCSDSRAPVEIIFDQGPGDLFVIRVAGNIVSPSQVGSVEYAAERSGSRLVVVLGHSYCGAVQATIDELQRPTANQSPNLRAIVGRIQPSVASLLDTDLRKDPVELYRQSIRANVRASVGHLRHGSSIIEHQIEHGGLLIVGAVYSLETGLVDFFDGIPEGA